LLLQFLSRDAEAETALLKALSLEPENMDFLYAIADHYIKRGKYRQAEEIVAIMLTAHPKNRLGHDLLRFIKKNLQGKQ